MEHTGNPKRRRKPARRANLNFALICLIAVLAIILVVVLCIAVGNTVPGPDTPPNSSTTTNSPSGTSSGTTTGVSTPAGPSLSVTAPTQSPLVVTDPTFTFTGTSDPAAPVTLNGQEIAQEADGSFSAAVTLTPGENTFTLSHKDESLRFILEYRALVQKFSPAGAHSYGSGETILFEVFAREGSTVTAQFRGETITLKASADQSGSGSLEGFCRYTASREVFNETSADMDLGSVTFTATLDGVTETYQSGTLICKKAGNILASDPSVTPDTDPYIDVGSGYICEVLLPNVETFDGKTYDYYSHPTNNYLPQGTVDYCATLSGGGCVVLRSGHRMYLTQKNIPSSKVEALDRYAGKLPDHNEIGISSLLDTGSHLVLTLDCLWKAPFYFDLGPQEYSYPNGGSDRSYTISAYTATYIDITFCYATQFTGTLELDASNPLFSSYEIIRNEADTTLRLNLKKTGGFHGWDAYYNEQDQLCFKFLKPAQIQVAENAYGASLAGVTIMLDVGHGGVDGGAVGKDVNGNQIEEADRNLALALALQKELESIGATVILNRSDDSRITQNERIMMLRQTAPDLCIALHHNALGGNYPNFGGLEVYYYNPFSMQVSSYIKEESATIGVYQRVVLGWHTYFVARQTVCPIVLMENGYMTCVQDLANTLDPVAIEKKAQAMTRGTVSYFLGLSE